MKKKTNHFLILLMSLIGNILCFLPLICSWSLPDLPEESIDKIPFLIALKSPAFSYALVSGISIAIPILFDFIGHSILSPEEFLSYRNSLSNLVLLVSFLVPDLLLLFYVVPGNHYRLLYVLEIQRIVNSASATFSYLNHFGGSIWCNDSMFILIVNLVIGAVFRLYSLFFTGTHLLICEVISLTALTLGSLVFFRMLMIYVQYLKPIYLAGRLTADQSCCIVYIISSTTAFCGIWALIIFYHYPKWYEFNTTMLVLENVIFSWYYLIITVFQGRSAIREASIAKQSLEIKKMFVRYISHEIRTPLNTVKMGLQVLVQELEGEGIRKDKLDIITDTQLACENAVNILNDLLMFDKLEAGILKLEMEKFPVWEFLELTLRPFRLQALQKNVSLTVKIPNINRRHRGMNTRGRSGGGGGNSSNFSNSNSSPSTHPTASSRGVLLCGDRYKLSQVISNVTSNAIKFTQEGGCVEINAYLLTENNIKIEEDGDGGDGGRDRGSGGGEQQGLRDKNGTPPLPLRPSKLRIEVTDNGAGLSEENQKRLFNEIIQFNPGTLQQGGGSGLGLFISKGIMDAHGGTISVSSRGEGEGCTFTMELHLDSRKSQRSTTTTTSSATTTITNPVAATTIAAASTASSFSQTNGAVVAATQRDLVVVMRGSTLGTLSSKSKYIVDQIRSIGIGMKPHIVPDGDPLPSSQGAFFEHKQNMELEPRMFGQSRQSYSDLESLSVSDCNSVDYRDSVREALTECPISILVVDDSKLNRSMMIRLLKNRCGGFTEGGDGQEAVAAVTSYLATGTPPIDVILMDFVMPNMDGPTAVKCIRELGFTGLIIGLTGNALPEDLRHFKSQGADEVLVKPLDVLLFDSIISRWKKKKKKKGCTT